MWPEYAADAQNVGVWLHCLRGLETSVALGMPRSWWERLGARGPRQGQTREVWVPGDLACFSEAPVHSSELRMEKISSILPLPFTFINKVRSSSLSDEEVELDYLYRLFGTNLLGRASDIISWAQGRMKMQGPRSKIREKVLFEVLKIYSISCLLCPLK